MVIRLVHNDTEREREVGEGEGTRRRHSLLPVWWQYSLGLVPPRQSVDP